MWTGHEAVAAFKMLRQAAQRAVQEVPASQTRGYLSSIKVDFTDDVAFKLQGSKSSDSVIDKWNSTKAATEDVLRLLDAYREAGDANSEPYLKHHNPRTFEDFSRPIPNFRQFELKAGDVPKFFDTVLQRRAEDAVDKKDAWWEQRKAEVQEAAKKSAKPLPVLPVPKWQYGSSLPLDDLKRVTDALIQSLEPKRKLKLPVLPAQVTDSLTAFAKQLGQEAASADLQAAVVKLLAEKAVVVENGKELTNFKYLSTVEAAKLLQERRAKVHERWVKVFGKRLAVHPEYALIPLKELEYLIASHFKDFNPKYNAIALAASKGTKSLGERLAESSSTDSVLLSKERPKLLEMFPASEQEVEAMKIAKSLEDQALALEKLLGPALKPEGSPDTLLSEHTEAVTKHLYKEGRYFYQEGLKLAERYKADEVALAESLKPVYGDNVDVKHFQHNPRTPIQVLLDRQTEVAARSKEFEAEKQKLADHPYLLYVAEKKQAFISDPSNLEFTDVNYLEITKELFDIQMAELRERERWLDEAEEEELWQLTLLRQARHINQHIDTDLPQGVLGYMDPILFKKIDFETTHTLDLMHKEIFEAADSDNGQYIKDQWGLEMLSHHFLPLIRYRRKKYRELYGSFPPELGKAPAKKDAPW